MMNRFNCALRAFGVGLAVSLAMFGATCTASAHTPIVTMSEITRVAVSAQPKEELTLQQAEAKIALLESQIVEAKKTLDASQASEVRESSPVNAVVTAATGEAYAATPSAITSEIPEVVFEETFTTKSVSAGWNAWKHQSHEYKKANPWNKVLAENCTREPRICARTARPNTKFYLPATNVRVLIPIGVTTPEAMTVTPTETPGVLKLSPEKPVTAAANLIVAQEDNANLRAKNQLMWLVLVGTFCIMFCIIVGVLLHKNSKNQDPEVERLKNLNKEISADLMVMRERAKTNAGFVRKAVYELPPGVTSAVYGKRLILDSLGVNSNGELLVDSPWNTQGITLTQVGIDIAEAQKEGRVLDGLCFAPNTAS
jgi:hypothetical protein